MSPDLIVGAILGLIIGWAVGRNYGRLTLVGTEEENEDERDHPEFSQVLTIPVPEGWSVEQAWECIQRGDTFPRRPNIWADIETRNNRLVQVLEVYE